MVHVSEYHIGKKRKDEVLSNIVLEVICIKCGRKFAQQDIEVFFSHNYICQECNHAKEDGPRKFPGR